MHTIRRDLVHIQRHPLGALAVAMVGVGLISFFVGGWVFLGLLAIAITPALDQLHRAERPAR